MSNQSSPSVNSYPDPETPDNDESYSSCFHPTHYNRSLNFNHSPILIERGLNLTKIDQWGLSRVANEGWGTFVQTPSGRINVSVVREFYAVLSEVRSVESTFCVQVRGVFIPFTSFAINQIFQIPPTYVTPNPHFEFAWQLHTAANTIDHCAEANRVLFPSYLNSRNFSTAALMPHLRTWKRFINSRVYPTTDFAGIDDDELLLLYAITVGAYIDWGVLIHKTAVVFALNRHSYGKPMPYAWLITNLCVHCGGVMELDTDEIFPSRVPQIGYLPVDTPGRSSTG